MSTDNTDGGAEEIDFFVEIALPEMVDHNTEYTIHTPGDEFNELVDIALDHNLCGDFGTVQLQSPAERAEQVADDLQTAVDSLPDNGD